MIKLTIAAAAIALLAACSATTEDPREGAADGPTGRTTEAIAAEQICCNTIAGYGSVVYYQRWAGYTWVTTESSYHQGGGCPGTSGNCQRIEPVR